MNRSRRAFLKISGLAVAAVAFTRRAFGITPISSVPSSLFSTTGTTASAVVTAKTGILSRLQNPSWNGISYTSSVICPVCGSMEQRGMPIESPLRIYQCPKCKSWLSPKQGDHCIFDSYGSLPCAAIQIKARRAKGLVIFADSSFTD